MHTTLWKLIIFCLYTALHKLIIFYVRNTLKPLLKKNKQQHTFIQDTMCKLFFVQNTLYKLRVLILHSFMRQSTSTGFSTLWVSKFTVKFYKFVNLHQYVKFQWPVKPYWSSSTISLSNSTYCQILLVCHCLLVTHSPYVHQTSVVCQLSQWDHHLINLPSSKGVSNCTVVKLPAVKPC